jgi:hypothetical protein
MIYPNKQISSGTMRNEDLLQTFASELERAANADISSRHPIVHNFLNLASEALAIVENGKADTESGSEVVAELFNALAYYAPKGCTFGAHEGDGAAYGFWRVDESEEIDED